LSTVQYLAERVEESTVKRLISADEVGLTAKQRVPIAGGQKPSRPTAVGADGQPGAPTQ
jgi:hypothetical protein